MLPNVVVKPFRVFLSSISEPHLPQNRELLVPNLWQDAAPMEADIPSEAPVATLHPPESDVVMTPNITWLAFS